MKNSVEPIVIEQEFNTTSETLWKAITDIDQMKLWFFDNIPDFKPEIGFGVSFNVKSTNRDFFHIWKVVEVVPQKKIRYTWSFKDIPGSSQTTFEISKTDNMCKLTLTAEVIDEFPDNIPEFKRESGLNGWNYFIKERLVDYFKSKHN